MPSDGAIISTLRIPCNSSHNFFFCAVMAKAATGDIHAVSRILGHSKTSTTERYLSRFDRDAVAEVFAKLNAGAPKGDG